MAKSRLATPAQKTGNPLRKEGLGRFFVELIPKYHSTPLEKFFKNFFMYLCINYLWAFLIPGPYLKNLYFSQPSDIRFNLNLNLT